MNSRPIFVAALLVGSLPATGCISGFVDHYSGKYRLTLEPKRTQKQVRCRIGIPAESAVRGSNEPHSYVLGSDYACDVFHVIGKIHKPGDGAAQATVCAFTLGTSELLMIPGTRAKTLWKSIQWHTLVVYYDESLHYSRHEIYDRFANKESDSSY